MRILYHHRTLGDGAEGIHVLEMVQAFRSLGHQVLLVAPVDKPGDLRQQNAITLSSIKRAIPGPIYELLEILYNLYGFSKIRKAISIFKPDFIYDRYITFNFSCVFAGSKYKIPTFLEINAPLAYERDHEADEKLYFKRIAYKLEKYICSNAYKAIVVSSPLRDYFVSLGIPKEKFVVLPNGVNPDKFSVRTKSRKLIEELRIKEGDIIIGFVGILRPWHGIDLLLKSFRAIYEEFPNTMLLLVGDGYIREEIEQKADNLGFRNSLRVTGRIPHVEVANYISLFDIAVSPKATFYASPMKILEYMAQAKAVIAPDMANIRDIISDGRNGTLFAPDSVESLTKHIRRLVLSKKKRDLIGKNALLEVEIKRNWTANAQKILEFM